MATSSLPEVGEPDRPRRDRRMSLGQHLIELRKRLMIAALALVVGMVVAFIITDPIIRLITIPIADVAAMRGETDKVEVMFTTITGPFDLRIRIAFATGLLISAPVWLWQIWAFIMRGSSRQLFRCSSRGLPWGGSCSRTSSRSWRPLLQTRLPCSTTQRTTTTSSSSSSLWSGFLSSYPSSSLL